MPRLFLRDDHGIVRRGLRELLEAEDDLEVVGEAATAADALARIPATRPDVAVLDVRLPDGSGVEVCRDIRSAHPEVQCLMLTSYADDEALFDAIMAGASGYVLKEVRAGALIDGIRQVAAGHSLLDPTVTASVLNRLRAAPEEDERFADLTPQERRILSLLAEGDRSVSDLLPLVGIEGSHLSQQLGVLRRAGLVTTRKEGTSVIYGIRDAMAVELLRVAKQLLINALSETTDLLTDLRAAR